MGLTVADALAQMARKVVDGGEWLTVNRWFANSNLGRWIFRI
jgi:hypothetical protein